MDSYATYFPDYAGLFTLEKHQIRSAKYQSCRHYGNVLANYHGSRRDAPLLVPCLWCACSATVCYALRSHAMMCDAGRCCAMLCCALLRYATLCCTVLRYACNLHTNNNLCIYYVLENISPCPILPHTPLEF